jgi:hypothetical protein
MFVLVMITSHFSSLSILNSVNIGSAGTGAILVPGLPGGDAGMIGPKSERSMLRYSSWKRMTKLGETGMRCFASTAIASFAEDLDAQFTRMGCVNSYRGSGSQGGLLPRAQ